MSDASSDKKVISRPKFGSPLLIIFNILAVFIISQILAGLIVAVFGHLIRPGFDSIDSNVVAQFFFVFLAEGFAVLFVFWTLNRQKIPISAIGLGRKPKLADAGKGLLGFAGFYVLLILTAGALSLIFPDINKGTQDVGFNNLSTHTDTLIAFFALVILPPLGEEILVRGYLFSGLRAWMRFVPAMLITSLLFGTAHLFGGDDGLVWGAAVNTFVLSVVLVYLREHTDALYAGMLVHMLNNMVAFTVHFK
jgi:membrane protease YdiL (CAAX protease family)